MFQCLLKINFLLIIICIIYGFFLYNTILQLHKKKKKEIDHSLMCFPGSFDQLVSQATMSSLQDVTAEDSGEGGPKVSPF